MSGTDVVANARPLNTGFFYRHRKDWSGELIPIDFCVNDERGNLTNRCHSIHIGDAFELSVTDARGLKFTPWTAQTLRIDRRCWNACFRQSHIGNIFWERYVMQDDCAAAFLEWLRHRGTVSIDCGWEETFNWFNGGILDRKWLRAKLIEASRP